MHFLILSKVLISGIVLLFQGQCFASIDEKLLAVHYEYPGPVSKCLLELIIIHKQKALVKFKINST